MSQPIYNLHNHTPFSDGAYTVDELCQVHLDCKDIKVDGIGICDHLFCTPSSREVKSERDFERLFANETRDYVKAVRAARQQWTGKLQVFCGAEINWPLNKGFLGIIRSMLQGIDYVLFEYVDWAGLTTLANQSRRWSCPIGLAHTNVQAAFPNTSMDQVVRTMANARIMYEISTKFLPIPDNDRWYNMLPNHRVSVCLGTDTHDDLDCIPSLAQLHDYAERHGLSEKYFLPEAVARQPVTA
jgi:histidinol phosphatase-like PHP family hydrolase